MKMRERDKERGEERRKKKRERVERKRLTVRKRLGERTKGNTIKAAEGSWEDVGE